MQATVPVSLSPSYTCPIERNAEVLSSTDGLVWLERHVLYLRNPQLGLKWQNGHAISEPSKRALGIPEGKPPKFLIAQIRYDELRRELRVKTPFHLLDVPLSSVFRPSDPDALIAACRKAVQLHRKTPQLA